MKDEIKEILEALKPQDEEFTKAGIKEYPLALSAKEQKILRDYITNLQEEVEDLRESDWAWHQLLKTQNKRMYRSKFLKEFQEEYGTNTYPDYDEIYKRYDKVKKENERLIEINKEQANHLISKDNLSYEDYKSRIDKAVAIIQNDTTLNPQRQRERLINTLTGDDE